MDVIRLSESGKNAKGQSWSVLLELPYFRDEELNRFYRELSERIRLRAECDGSNAMSYLKIVTDGEESFSLLIDLLFCRGRALTGLYRICDNRKNGYELPIPKRLKRRGCDCFCIKGNRAFAFRNLFSENETARRNEYEKFISQTVACNISERYYTF